MYTLPSERTTTWKPGIYTGDSYTGIPSYPVGITMQSSNSGAAYYVDATGASDASAAIRAAIAACATSRAVVLPAGTFRVDSTITNTSKNNVVLRGQGAGTTILQNNGTGATIQFRGSGLSAPISITSGYTKDSQTLVLAATTGISVGSYLMLSQTNDHEILDGPENTYMVNCIAQVVRVSTIVGTTITIDKPLYWTYIAANSPQVQVMASRDYVGVENLSSYSTAAGAGGISFSYVTNGWIYGVEVKGGAGALIALTASARCEVKRCYLHDATAFGASSGYGIFMFNRNCEHLIEDNITKHLRHHVIWEYGGSGCAVLYNYCDGAYDGLPSDTMLQHIHTHGGMPHMNLVEGNVAGKIVYDSSLSVPPSRYNTTFRNWSKGWHMGCDASYNEVDNITGGLRAIENHCCNLYNNYVANVLGRDGDYGTAVYEGTSPAQKCVYWLGTNQVYATEDRTYDWDGETHTIEIPDLRVTTGDTAIIRHGNYDYNGNQIVYVDGADTEFADSLWYSSKPDYFGALAWPPIGPDVVGYVTDIPATYRWDEYQTSGQVSDLFFAEYDESGVIAAQASVTGISTVTGAADITPPDAAPSFTLAIEPTTQQVRKPAEAAFFVSAYPAGGYVNDIALAVTGLPAGGAYTLDTNPIACNGTTTLRIDTSGIAATDPDTGTDYSLRLAGTETV